MAEPTDTPKILDELSRGTAARGNLTDRQRRTVTRMVVVLGLALAPVVLVLGGLAWTQWRLWGAVESLRLDIDIPMADTSESDRLTALEAEFATQTALLAQVRQAAGAAAEAQTAEVAALRQRLSELQGQLNERAGVDDDAWALAEAEFLLTTASRQLHVDRNIPGALALTQAADNVLVDLAVDTTAVRTALAAEMLALRRVQVVDVDGLYLRLAALRDQLPQLSATGTPVAQVQARLARDRQAPEAPAPQAWWQSLGESLGQVFVWRRWDTPPEVELPAPLDAFTLPTLNLLLEQAQSAVLQRRSGVYQAALRRATEVASRAGGLDEVASAAVVAELQALTTVDIEPALPETGRALAALRELRD